MTPNLFQREMSRHATDLGCTTHYGGASGTVIVTLEGTRIARISADGIILSEHPIAAKLEAYYQSTWEMFKSYRDAPNLPNSPGEEPYRMISQFGDVVFAAKDHPSYGPEFVTWQYTFDRQGYTLGHYFGADYEGAKKDFLSRSGLLSENDLFSEKELSVLFKAMKAADEMGGLDYAEHGDQIESIYSKMKNLHPEWFECPKESQGLNLQ